MNIEFFDTIDSTNLEAKRRFETLDSNDYEKLHKTVIVSETQTSGRGRLNRKFYSPPKNGLYFSVVYCKKNIKSPGIITANAAVAVCRAIKSIFSIDAKIKWVNDVFVNGKKVCGILTEGIVNTATKTIDAVIIGIGVNIYADKSMPDDLKEKAGAINKNAISNSSTIGTHNEEKIKRNFLNCILDNIFEILDNDTKQMLAIQEYKERSMLLGKKIIVFPIINNAKSYLCTAIDITENAELVVLLDNGTKKTLDSGEVSIKT